MKRILFILGLFACYVADSQTIYYPSDPESLFVPVQIMGSVRKVYVSELVKNRISKTKYTTDSTTMRGLINSNTTALSGKLNIADSAAMLANYRAAVIANTANIAANTTALSTGARYVFTNLSNWDRLRDSSGYFVNFKSTYSESPSDVIETVDTTGGAAHHRKLSSLTAGILPTYASDAAAATAGVSNYLNTTDNRIHYSNSIATWYRVAIIDSTLATTIYTQGWEGVTPPAAPSDWTFSTNMVTTSTNPLTGSKALTATATGVETAVMNTLETGSTVAVSSVFKKTNADLNGSEYITIARAATKVWSTMACYAADLVIGSNANNGGIAVAKRSGGTYSLVTTRVGQANGLVDANIVYKVTLSLSGTTTTVINVKLQRLSDNFYLNASGTWQSGVATASTYTDTSSPITALGYDGIVMLQTTSGGAAAGVSDDFSITQ